MPDTIELTRARVALFHIPEFILGIAFPLLYVFAIRNADHIPGWFRFLIGLAAIFGAGVAAMAIFKFFRVLFTDGPWRVAITEDRLIWETAIPTNSFPLDITLNDIDEVICLETLTKGLDKSIDTATTYEIRTKAGDVQVVSQSTAGVDPHRVFRLLQGREIPYRRYVLDRTEVIDNTTRALRA